MLHHPLPAGSYYLKQEECHQAIAIPSAISWSARQYLNLVVYDDFKVFLEFEIPS